METKLTKSQKNKLLNRVIDKDFLNSNIRIKTIFEREKIRAYGDLRPSGQFSHLGYAEHLSIYRGMGGKSYRIILRHLHEKGLISSPQNEFDDLSKTQKSQVRVLEKILEKSVGLPEMLLGNISYKPIEIKNGNYVIDNKNCSSIELMRICNENPKYIKKIAEGFAKKASNYWIKEHIKQFHEEYKQKLESYLLRYLR